MVEMEPTLSFEKGVADEIIHIYARAIMARPAEMIDAFYNVKGGLGAIENNMATLFAASSGVDIDFDQMPRSRLLKLINRDVEKATKHGEYAGHIFLTTVALCRSGLPFSQNRAVDIVKDRTGEKEQTLKNAWRDYQNSAHFWASFIVTDESHNEASNRHLMDRTRVNYAMYLAGYAASKKLFKSNKNPWQPCCISTGDNLKRLSFDMPNLTEYARGIALDYTTYK